MPIVHLISDASLPSIWDNLGATDIGAVPTLLIVAILSLYLFGSWRVARIDPTAPWSMKRTGAFAGAMLVVFVAVELFVGAYDDTLFYDHMIQHLLLIMVAAPLVAMGAPIDLLCRATSGSPHRFVTKLLGSRIAEVVGHPIFGFACYAVLIPVAHLTSIYNYLLTNELLHDNEHLAFLVFGYLFWRPVVGIESSRHPLSPGMRMLYLALAVPVDTFSGLALVSTGHELFPAYLSVHRSWGPSLVGDLHIGGAVMWVGGDTLMVFAMIPIVVQWVRAEDEKARQIDALLDSQLGHGPPS